MGVKDLKSTTTNEVRLEQHDTVDKGVNTSHQQHNESNLISLSNAYSPAMRKLAASNLKYYPEHIVVLLDLLSSENDKSVIEQVEISLLYLAKSDTLKSQIICHLNDLIENGDVVSEFAMEAIKNLSYLLKGIQRN